jgi:hypothetical protein
MPLINIIDNNVLFSTVCRAIIDATEHLVLDGKKDTTWIMRQINPMLTKYDPNQEILDMALFDEASNVQNAGKILVIINSRITVLQAHEHVAALFFVGLIKLDVIKVCLHLFCLLLLKLMLTLASGWSA